MFQYSRGRVTHRGYKYEFGVFDDSHATKAKKWFNDSLEGLYNLYYTKYGNPTTQSTSGGSSSRTSGGNQISNLLHRLKEHKSKKARSDSAISSEYERYIHEDFITHLQTNDFAGFDVLGFWKSKESMFPVLSCMAMDVLSALDFEEEILTIEVQDNEATPLSDEEITLDAASQGTMASGSGGEEPDFDYDLTNYDIDD
ncbi:zinc finger BED domain-containing protein RICESLEEPER 2-like protein [Tanacetum coccineum]